MPYAMMAKQPHPVVPALRVSGTRIKLVTSNKNRGKGNAIISGISQAEGDYIAFCGCGFRVKSRTA